MRTRDMVRSAKRDGTYAGKCAASWVFDGNTDDSTYVRVLQGIEDGDPEVLDAFNVPNLSGEWADDPTPSTLADDYGITPENDPDGWRLDAVCQAWEDAAQSTFWAEVERVCRLYVSA